MVAVDPFPLVPGNVDKLEFILGVVHDTQ
jgi:hypothetical protein